MDNTAIQAGSPPSHGPVIQAAIRPMHRRKSLGRYALEIAASLRITVVLFALSLFLVFYGTLAQADKGVWTVVAEYFRSLYVWIPFNIVFLKPILQFNSDLPGALPYPGGWLLGTVLLVNLLAAHIVSFRLTWRRAGIVMLHAGIVVMMLGELITGLCAVESHMHINEHAAASHVEQWRFPELAVVDPSDLKKDRVTVIPTSLLRKGGVISDPALPFDVDVKKYMVNSILWYAKADKKSQATHGQGRQYSIEEKPEGAGVDKKQNVDAGAAIVALKDKKTGESLGTYILSVLIDKSDWVTVDGKTYEVSLRFRRVYKDYTFRLDKLDIKYYPNTNKPKDYSSYIHLTDPSQKEERDVRIWMNHPLTYNGETFYQIGVDEQGGQPSTTLQVVHNPGWMLPYISCFMVATGMLFHFGLNLYRFVERRAL
jgi:hypothetical protein